MKKNILPPSQKEPPQFSSFIWAGYECTYSKIENNRRLDLLAATKHDDYCQLDYNLIKNIGITVAREGLAWYQIDQGTGRYDFSRFEEILRIGKEEKIQQVWDLNHFDFPEDVDPFSAKFITRFSTYATRAIQVIRQYIEGTIYIVPCNEISFFSWIAGDQGIWAPYAKNKGWELKQQLIRATIASMEAIWEVDKDVRFIQVDPFLYRAPKKPITPQARQMAREFREVRFQAWDILTGKLNPELGGDPKYLDIIGVNYYPQNQEWIVPEVTEKNILRYEMIPWYSKHRISFGSMLGQIYNRYHRPIVVTETGGWGDLRKRFWKRTLRQVDEALVRDVPVYGVCAYPIVDRPDWFDDHLVNSGLWDFEPDDLSCKRVPHMNTIAVIQNYQKNFTKNHLM